GGFKVGRTHEIAAGGIVPFSSYAPERIGIVTLRDPKDGKVRKTIMLEDGPAHSGDFSLDGKILALATGDRFRDVKVSAQVARKGTENLEYPPGKLKLMEVATGKILKSLTTNRDFTESVKFSPDGRILATGGADGTLMLWDARTWKELCKLSGNKHGISSLAFSPDGTLLASADDYSIKLWD